jgi:hypothetical protein
LEQEVIVHLRLRDGSPEEQQAVMLLEGELQEAIERACAGEFDGDEFGAGECVLFMYCTDADRLFGQIEPILKAAPAAAGGYAIKRYGEPQDPNASQVRVTW